MSESKPSRTQPEPSSPEPSRIAKGPHQDLARDDPRERFCCRLFDRLWNRYRQRVTHAAVYEQVVERAGATFVNDHLAFRSFACQRPTTGIVSLSRVFEALGYQAAGTYLFPDKHLGAIHFQHPNARLPKLFLSELQVWLLPEPTRDRIHQALASHRPLIEDRALAELTRLRDAEGESATELLRMVVDFIEQPPWPAPVRQDLEALHGQSQYAAWVLVHGYNVNHFTSLINSHQVESLDDIEKTVAALVAAGVPMKAEIEGARGSKLRQTATEAVVIDVPVRDGQSVRGLPWTYAYFELAERGEVPDPETGRSARFEGFLGPQATRLFEMTRRG